MIKNGQDFLKYVRQPLSPKRQCHILWMDAKLMADPECAAKAVKGAILTMQGSKRRYPHSVKITGDYNRVAKNQESVPTKLEMLKVVRRVTYRRYR